MKKVLKSPSTKNEWTYSLMPLRFVIFSIQFEDKESHLKTSVKYLQHSLLRKLRTHSQLDKVDKVASIFSIGGSCI